LDLKNKIKKGGLRFFTLATGLIVPIGQPAFAQKAPQSTAAVCSTKNTAVTESKIQRAIRIACDEYALWGKPMIDSQGHLIQIGPMEGETDKLTNGEMAWTRVLYYWTAGVGVDYLYGLDDFSAYSSNDKNAFIRTRIIDNPWSGAFISYVMKSAGFNRSEFALNDGHIRYIKPAFAATLAGKHNEANDYAFTAQNPLSTRISVGDLICYAREGRYVYGVRGFNDWLMVHYNDDRSLKTHCDIVVGVAKNRAYSIGGNVAQSVTMRQLNLNSKGFLSSKHILPVTQIDESWLANVLDHENETLPACEPISGVNCDMNRKDWVILLKARS
jgi:hypothetical protein